MRRKLKPALSGGITLLVAAAVLLTGAAPAFAAAPPWEPDPNALGAVVFYDAAGNVLTGGSDLNHLADYAAATTAGSPGATRANLIFAAPDHTKVTGLWATGSGSANTTYPNNAAPAPVTGPGFANPLVTLGATDANLNAFLGSIVKDTTPGYANVYQVRVKDTGAGGAGSGTKYWETNIAVNEAAGTWTVLWPEVTATTTSITTVPANGGSAVTGSNVSLSATVSPASNGSIQFYDGATPVGSPHPVTTGSPTANDTDTAPAIGTHQYAAKFTPAGGTLVDDSTSPVSTVTITPPQTATSTALSANPSTAPQYTPVTLTANVTPLEANPGTMEFFDGAALLGTDTTEGAPGEYQFTTSTLTLGVHDNITARFTPDDNSYARSTSQPVTVEITPSECPGAPDPNGGSCTDEQTVQVTVNPGSLTISTPYTPQNPFVLPDMVLNSAGTLLSTDARFPNAADEQIVVTSSLAGNPNWTVSVSGTDLTSGSKTIDGQGLGLTGGTLLPSPVFPGTVAFTDNPARNPNTPGTDHGIKGGPWTFAQSSGGGNGSAAMYGTLTLLAPTSTQAGTYTGTITFTVA